MLLVFNFQKSNDEIEWDCIENPQRKLNCTILHEFDASPLKLLHSVKHQLSVRKIEKKNVIEKCDQMVRKDFLL